MSKYRPSMTPAEKHVVAAALVDPLSKLPDEDHENWLVVIGGIGVKLAITRELADAYQAFKDAQEQAA